MSFVNDVNNYVEPMVGGSSDFPQRMLNESFAQQAPLAFAPTSGSKSYKNVAQQAAPSVVEEIQEEQENLSDRLDKLEADAPQKTKGVKQFWKKHHKKIKTGILVGIALYAGYHMFLKGRLKFGQGGHSPSPAPMPAPEMEAGGEINAGDI